MVLYASDQFFSCWVSFLKTVSCFTYIFFYALKEVCMAKFQRVAYCSDIGYEPMSFFPTDSQENPELIWNDEAREKVSQEVAQMTEE